MIGMGFTLTYVYIYAIGEGFWSENGRRHNYGDGENLEIFKENSRQYVGPRWLDPNPGKK